MRPAANRYKALGLSKPDEATSTGYELYWFWKTALLEIETADVVEAIRWVTDPGQFDLQMPDNIHVDASKLALMGHSYGGRWLAR